MPLSILKKLGLGELKPTTVSLQLANRSIKYPMKVIKDVLIKVGKFYFPVDFIVLKIKEDHDMLIILGRPFLAIGEALIDVECGKLIHRVGEECTVFNVFKAAQCHSIYDSCKHRNN